MDNDSVMVELIPILHYTRDGIEKEVFTVEHALAELLGNDVIFLNTYWWNEDWPEDARKATAILVNCNDVFAWACADAEEIFYDEIEDFYKNYYLIDKYWGPAIWCIKKRNLKPQTPVYNDIKSKGIWDLDSMGLN